MAKNCDHEFVPDDQLLPDGTWLLCAKCGVSEVAPGPKRDAIDASRALWDERHGCLKPNVTAVEMERYRAAWYRFYEEVALARIVDDGGIA